MLIPTRARSPGAAGRPRTPPVAAVWGLPLQGQAASSNQHMEFEILLSYWAHLPPHPGPISPRYSPWVSTDHFELTWHPNRFCSSCSRCVQPTVALEVRPRRQNVGVPHQLRHPGRHVCGGGAHCSVSHDKRQRGATGVQVARTAYPLNAFEAAKFMLRTRTTLAPSASARTVTRSPHSPSRRGISAPRRCCSHRSETSSHERGLRRSKPAHHRNAVAKSRAGPAKAAGRFGVD